MAGPKERRRKAFNREARKDKAAKIAKKTRWNRTRRMQVGNIVPIKVAVSVIFQLVMNSLSGRYKTEVLLLVRWISNLGLLAWRVGNQTLFSLDRINPSF